MSRRATALNFVIPSVSRGTRDLLCALPSNNSLQLRPSISTNAKVDRRPQFVIPSVAEDLLRSPNNSLQLCPSISTNAKVDRRPQICHPELSSRALAERGTCCAPFPLTTPYSSVHPSPPWHWWRWMDGSTVTAPTRFPLSTFSSTHSASCAVRRPFARELLLKHAWLPLSLAFSPLGGSGLPKQKRKTRLNWCLITAPAGAQARQT